MVYDIIDLKRDIRIILDQNTTSTQLFQSDDIDTLSLDDIIESKIATAAKIIESKAPSYLLDSGRAFGDSILWDRRVGIGSGSVHLPDDFMRLVSFQMSDWEKSVTIAISEDSSTYELQKSRYPGVRGCPQNPVVAITNQPIGLVLEFYSCTGGDGVYIKRARYIATPRIESGKIDLCEKLKDAISYYAAYMAALSVGQTDLAGNLLNISNELSK